MGTKHLGCTALLVLPVLCGCTWDYDLTNRSPFREKLTGRVLVAKLDVVDTWYERNGDKPKRRVYPAGTRFRIVKIEAWDYTMFVIMRDVSGGSRVIARVEDGSGERMDLGVLSGSYNGVDQAEPVLHVSEWIRPVGAQRHYAQEEMFEWAPP